MKTNQQREIPKELLYRELRFERAAVNEAKRSVDVSFSSETDSVTRWGEPEILDHGPGAVNLTRLNSIGVVLFNHHPDLPIGRIENARVEGGRGLATLIFDEDEESEKIWRKILSGTLRGISVSYTYDEYSFLGENETSADGRFKGPCLLVKRWTALEISVVSVPADATVGIGRSNGADLGPLVAAIVAGVTEGLRQKQQETPVPDSKEAEQRGLGELEADIFWLESQIM